MCKEYCKKGGCTSALVAKSLVVIGGVNWGLVGLGMFLGSSNLNVVNLILGDLPVVEAVVYVLVGIAALVLAFGCKCGKCKNGVCAPCGENCCKEEDSAHSQGSQTGSNM